MSQTFICSQRVTPTLSEPFITPQNPQNDIGQMTSFYLGMEYLFITLSPPLLCRPNMLVNVLRIIWQRVCPNCKIASVSISGHTVY